MNFKFRRAAKVAVVTAVGVAVTLSGCSLLDRVSGTEKVLQALAEQDTDFRMPQNLSPTGSWTNMAVVCPYYDAASIPEPFHVGDDKALNDEGSQWLFFIVDDEGNTRKIEIGRNIVDFCSGDSPNTMVADPEQRWVAEQQQDDGRWTIELLPR